MTDTPRTDALAEHYKPTHWQVSYEGMEAFARELERENGKIRALGEVLRNRLNDFDTDPGDERAIAAWDALLRNGRPILTSGPRGLAKEFRP